MMIIIGIIVSIIVFSIIVLLHEYGHFKRARIFGVKVEEFGLGIPPKAKKIYTDKKGTVYTLNWLPLGGFVKLKGENINTFDIYDEKGNLLNNEELEKFLKEKKNIFDKEKNLIEIEEEKEEILKKLKENTDKDSLLNISAWKASIIILAGVFMNFVLAFVIFTTLFFIGVSPIGINQKIENDYNLKIIPTFDDAIKYGVLKENPGILLGPLSGSIAYQAGIKDNDLLLEINNQKILDYKKVKEIITQNKNKEITLKIERSICETKDINCKKELLNIQLTPDNTGKVGVYIAPNIQVQKDFKYNYSFTESVKYGFLETYGQIKLTFKAIGILVQKIFNPKDEQERKEAINSLSGPIGIADLITNSISNGIIFIIIIAAIISINLGVFNLLPIPALDGGRFIFIVINGTIQKIFGKRAINSTLENILHLGFFILLIILSILIAYNDIYKIINR